MFLSNCFSQNKEITLIKVSKNKEYSQQENKRKNIVIKKDTFFTISYLAFSKLSSLSNVIKLIPDTCNQLSYMISVSHMNTLKETLEKENVFSINANIILRNLKPGQKFFIENIKTSCVKLPYKNYTIIIGN